MAKQKWMREDGKDGWLTIVGSEKRKAYPLFS